MIVGGGVSGGLSSSIAGGDFGQGMLQGLITAGLNHVAHMGDELVEKDPPTEKDRLNEVVTIRGKKYHKNTGNIFAKIGNAINGSLGGDSDYFVEHKPYNPAEENMLSETISTGADFFAVGQIAKGVKLVGMGLSTVPKKAIGERVVLGASENANKASVYYKKLFIEKGLNRNIDINLKLGGYRRTIGKLPALGRRNASSWPTFYGRNAPVFGGARIVGGTGYLYNSVEK